MSPTTSSLFVALAVAVAGCATSDETEVPDPAGVDEGVETEDDEDKADGISTTPLHGVWRSVETPRNGEIQRLSIYKKTVGLFSKKLAYDLSAQTIRPDGGSTSHLDWGFLKITVSEMTFESKSGQADREGSPVPPAPQTYEVQGTGDTRTLYLTEGSTATPREFKLDLTMKCGSGLPRCASYLKCKSDWCVWDR